MLFDQVRLAVFCARCRNIFLGKDDRSAPWKKLARTSMKIKQTSFCHNFSKPISTHFQDISAYSIRV